VLDIGNNFSAKPRITEILQFDRHCHRIAILQESLLRIWWCKPVKALGNRRVNWASEMRIHDSRGKRERDDGHVKWSRRIAFGGKWQCRAQSAPLEIGKAATLVML